MTKVGDAVLDAPVRGRVAEGGAVRRMPDAPALRRGLDRDRGEDFAEPRGRDDEEGAARGLRFRLGAGVPRTAWGRALAAAVVLAGIGGCAAVVWGMRSMLLHEPRLVIESSAGVQITGNRHLTRGQLLSVFGEDVDRNILTVPLAERRAELERLPWVEHATVMRLLPNRFRVAVTERTPVAFVRQGSRIGLVDGHGVLLDMASDGGDGGGEMHYSFPVVSGVGQGDPLTTRAARMKLFQRFERELDAGGAVISKDLGEVDVSNPEDVKALVPSGKAEVLVHFGDKDFLRRYGLFAKNAPGWLAAHPRLLSADMRYEHQVVLEMGPGAVEQVDGGVKVASSKEGAKAGLKAVAGQKHPTLPPHLATTSGGPPGLSVKPKGWGPQSGSTARAAVANPAHGTERDEQGTPRAGGHLETAFDVPAKKAKSSGAAPR